MSGVPMFEGVRVVELAQWVFVPGAGGILSDWGAEVVKIEHPTMGDPYRALITTDARDPVPAVDHSMQMINAGKRSVGLDVKQPAGREVLMQLLEQADVFLTSFRPDSLDRLGIGVADVRARAPRVIYARGSGFGTRGPDAGKSAFDASAYWARGGFAHALTPDDHPYPVQLPVGSRPDGGGAFDDPQVSAKRLHRRDRVGRAAGEAPDRTRPVDGE